MAIQTPRVAPLRLPGGGRRLCHIALCSLLSAPAAWSATPEPPPAIGSYTPASSSGTANCGTTGSSASNGTPTNGTTASGAAPNGATPDATATNGTTVGTATANCTPEVLIEANEPKYVAPTLRDRIGRIWAPVYINGKGPFRLVLDTGASHSAIISRVADTLGVSAQTDPILLRGVTGSAVVPAVHVDRMEVGDLLIEPSTLPIVADAFGGAEGVLGREGLPDKRIFADFRHDRLVISRSHRERARVGYAVIPLKLDHGGLLTAEVRVGSIRTQAIIDTGGQQTVGNLALREALMKHPPRDAISEDIIGVTLDVQRGDNIAAPPIELGSLKLSHARVAFGDMYLFDHLKLTHKPTLMIGMDVLGSFDVLIIDYKMQQMQILTRNPTVSANNSLYPFQ